jgi:hypothetical protein
LKAFNLLDEIADISGALIPDNQQKQRHSTLSSAYSRNE